MRDLVFRAWDDKAAAWHLFNLRPLAHLDLTDRDLDEDSLSQATGVTDKNGNVIFEGDVLKDRSEGTCTVRFASGTFRLVRDSNGISWPLAENSVQYEVFGNIFNLG